MSCPKYDEEKNVMVCPECGAEMTREGCCDDLATYTSGRCSECSYSCCGECV